MTTARPRPNRGPSAAAENRAAILAAARIRFADGGLSVPLSAIARDAGVGQGSLYRHFPDRLALAVAVFDENLDALERHVAGGAAGVAALLDLVEQQAVVSPGLIDLMWQHLDDERVAHLGSRVSEVAEAAIAHDRTTGIVPDEVDARDVLAAIAMLADLTARSSQLGDDVGHPGRAELVTQADRARALVRRGLGIDG